MPFHNTCKLAFLSLPIGHACNFASHYLLLKQSIELYTLAYNYSDKYTCAGKPVSMLCISHIITLLLNADTNIINKILKRGRINSGNYYVIVMKTKRTNENYNYIRHTN